MSFVWWIVLELASYGVVPWAAFVLITLLAARVGRWHDVVFAHVVVSATIVWLDLSWIQSQMQTPGWNPNAGPDQDFIFMLGCAFRVVLINLILLPVSLLGRRSRHPRS